MRETLRAELGALVGDLARTVRVAGQMMTNASISLHQVDLRLAESVISDVDEMMAVCDDMDQRCLNLLVQQPSVATDLRAVVAAMHAMRDLKRMGNLAQHIAEISRLRHPMASVPAGVRPVLARMGVLTSRLAEDAAAAIEGQDPTFGNWLAEADNKVNALRRRTFQILFSENWAYGVESAVDVALVSRYYERFGDHAVAIACQASFLVTGLPPQP